MLQDLMTKPGVSIKSPMRKDSQPGQTIFQTPKGTVSIQAPPIHCLLEDKLETSRDNHFSQILMALQNPNQEDMDAEDAELEEGEIDHGPTKIPSLLDMDTTKVHNVMGLGNLKRNKLEEMAPPSKPISKEPVTVPRLAVSIEGQIRRQLAYLDDMKRKGISETAALAAQNSELLARYAPPLQEGNNIDIPPPPLPPCIIPGMNGSVPERQKLVFDEQEDSCQQYQGLYNYYNEVVTKYNNIMGGEGESQELPHVKCQDPLPPQSYPPPVASQAVHAPPVQAVPCSTAMVIPPIQQPAGPNKGAPRRDPDPPVSHPAPGIILDPEQQAVSTFVDLLLARCHSNYFVTGSRHMSSTYVAIMKASYWAGDGGFEITSYPI